MSKKFLLISLALILIIILLIGSFFVMQNFNKPQPKNNTISNSSIEVPQNAEVKNPFVKNNQSEESSLESISSESFVTSSTQSTTSTISSTNSEIKFTEVKTFPDNSKIFDLKGFSQEKLQDESLITIPNYFPNQQNAPSLFIEKNSKKRFLGYGAVDSFQFQVKGKTYNLTVFEDETGYPSLYLTDSDYTELRKIYTGFEYSSGKFTQINFSTKFTFEGTSDNGEILNVLIKTFDILDVHDFEPEE